MITCDQLLISSIEILGRNPQNQRRIIERFSFLLHQTKKAEDMAKTPTKKVNRDSGTGKFVTEKFAKSHPKTTETETRPVKIPPKKSK
jgi:hypothetical protein